MRRASAILLFAALLVGALAIRLVGETACAADSRSTNDFLFIDNGQLRLGVNRAWGAGIAWLSESDGRNLVNHWDHGRLIQQSYYGEKDGSLWNKTPWTWNPVQGGDWRGHPAKVLVVSSGTNWI